MKGFGCLLVIFLALLFIFVPFFSAVRNILHTLFYHRRTASHETTSDSSRPRRKNKKRFSKDEGTYIDFEEIK